MPARFNEVKAERYGRHNRRLGARIRDARLEAGHTQESLGEMIGRPKTWVSAVEAGRNGVSTMDLDDIAIALDRKVSFFFSDGSPVHQDCVAPRTLSEWIELLGNTELAAAHYQMNTAWHNAFPKLASREAVAQAR